MNYNKLEFLDKRKNIKYKCRSCKREWVTHNFRDLLCIYCKSDKITENDKEASFR